MEHSITIHFHIRNAKKDKDGVKLFWRRGTVLFCRAGRNDAVVYFKQ